MSRTKPDTGETKMIVYGHDFCSQARGLIHVLNRHEIDYEYRDVVSGKPKWKKELKQLANGNLSVPTVVFPDGVVMVEPWPDQVLEHLGLKEPGFVDKLASWFGKGK